MHFLDKLKDAEHPDVAGFKAQVAQLAETQAGAILNGEHVSGSRNEVLNKVAYIGGILVAEEKATDYWVSEELMAACDANGYCADYGEDEARRIILAGMEAGVEAAPKKEHDNPIYSIALTAAELGSLPPAEWLVDDLLLENSLAVLVADPNVGKSFLAISLAASIATGKPQWAGRRLSRKGKTVYLAGEGLSGLNNRRMAWEKFHRSPMGSDFHVVPAAIPAGSKGWDSLVEYVADMRPELVVIDTLAKTAGDYDENLPSEMSKYLAHCDRLRIASGGTVLVIHHTGKGGSYRGGSSIKGDVDTLMYLRNEGGSLALWVDKQKDGPNGDMGMYKLQEVEIGRRGDGKPITSAVFTRLLPNPFSEEHEV